jgi:hypothetical protein
MACFMDTKLCNINGLVLILSSHALGRRATPRPVCYLEDLFVASEACGNEAGRLLVNAVIALRTDIRSKPSVSRKDLRSLAVSSSPAKKTHHLQLKLGHYATKTRRGGTRCLFVARW